LDLSPTGGSTRAGAPVVELDAVRAVPLFKYLSQEQLAEVVTIIAIRRFAKGSLLVREGEPGDAIHIVLDGSVSVLRIAPDGRETILSILKEGDFFGEMSVLDASPRSASIRALTPVEVGVIEQKPMLELLDKDPRIARSLIVNLSRRLREANALIAATTSGDMRSRLALLLVNLAANFGESADGGTRITLRLTNQQMADMIGTTRETVNRTLNKFWDERIIDMKTANIVVLDRTQLEAMMP
jgi:CRP/FNR family cyclic AMP-dependent transcriptional regulator